MSGIILEDQDLVDAARAKTIDESWAMLKTHAEVEALLDQAGLCHKHKLPGLEQLLRIKASGSRDYLRRMAAAVTLKPHRAEIEDMIWLADACEKAGYKGYVAKLQQLTENRRVEIFRVQSLVDRGIHTGARVLYTNRNSEAEYEVRSISSHRTMLVRITWGPGHWIDEYDPEKVVLITPEQIAARQERIRMLLSQGLSKGDPVTYDGQRAVYRKVATHPDLLAITIASQNMYVDPFRVKVP